MFKELATVFGIPYNTCLIRISFWRWTSFTYYTVSVDSQQLALVASTKNHFMLSKMIGPQTFSRLSGTVGFLK